MGEPNVQTGAPRVIVVGAGVGGLTASIALRSAGIEVLVFDQLGGVGATAVGGGFHLWPNAIGALRELGLAEVVRARGAPIESTEFHSSRGRKLAEWPIGEIARELDAFDVGMSRKDLAGVLHEAADLDSVSASAKLVSFDDDEGGVRARFADGREERGDVLVGADGLRSTVRSQLMGADDPDYAGYVQWQTLIEGGQDLFPAGVERITFGPGKRTVMHHVGGGRLFWACVIYGPADAGGKPAGRKAKLLDGFGGWPEPIPTAIDATPEEEIVGLPIFDRKPVKSWGRGRVTLLGDAAHPMTTNTSQGGNQAIEDGVVLARLLSAGQDVASALRAYEERRIARTTPLVKNSRWVSDLNAWRHPLRVGLRNGIFTVGLPRKGLKDLRRAVATPL
jgi:2-polyprenyl-6-methoxyphenol hydroxylase-like FAD-dependent oxidoreductase